MLGEAVLLLVAHGHVDVHVRGRAQLLERVWHLDVIAEHARAVERDQRFAAPEEAGVHAPGCGPVVVVEIQRAKRAGLLAVSIDDGFAAPRQDGVEIGHALELPAMPIG